MDATAAAGDVLINSIILLGISPAQASREYGCEFAKDMFLQANQKGLNSVLHLLFERIRGKDSFKKDIKGAWPVKDTVQQRDYNKVIHRLIMDLTQLEIIPKYLAANLPQSFRQLCGLRLTALLCCLAAHTLGQDRTLRALDFSYCFQELPSKPLAVNIIYKSLRAQAFLERSKLATALIETAHCQANWVAAAESLGTAYCDALRNLSDLQGEDAAFVPGSGEAQAGADGSSGAREDGELHSAGTCEAAVKVDSLWTAFQQGANRQQQLQENLKPVLTQAEHPYILDGTALQPAADGRKSKQEAGAKPAVAAFVHFPALLQALESLVRAYMPALPERGEVERLYFQHRPITPLLEQDQQGQMASITQQHKSRLQSQQQLSNMLHELLTSVGAHKQALHECVIHGLQLGAKKDLAPDSPAKDLIRASYPLWPGAEGKPTVSQPSSLQESSIDHVLLPEPRHVHGGALKKTISLPSVALPCLSSAAGLEAGLSQAAYDTQFVPSYQPLKPFAANTGAHVLDPFGAQPIFANTWVAENADALGVSAVKMAARAAAQDKLTVRSPLSKLVETSSEAKVTTFVEPVSVVPVSAAPRRLSFSGTTPQVVAIEFSSPKASDTLEAATGVQAGPLAVADIMARLQRLKATKKI